MSIVEAWLVAWRRRVDGRPRSKKAKAGWYYDPRKQARYRYWDGAHWTDEVVEELPA